MIDYLIGVDGGGTGTRVRIAANAPRTVPLDGARAHDDLAQGSGGPSGLGLGIGRAWAAIDGAIEAAFATLGIDRPEPARMAIGLGLAGVHNKQWAQEFTAASRGYAALVLETDAFTTLMGAHGGRPGAIVAIGTGSVGEALLPDGGRREVGGWGFPAGDEASGGWIGLRAINHMQQVLDGRRAPGAFSDALVAACGARRDAIQVWLGNATQTTYASLAPLVLQHAEDPVARAILADAGREVAAIARALDPDGALPLALCGGLGLALRPWLPPELAARAHAPEGDSAAGALRMIELYLAHHIE
ncbi:BadF/BadG/BcrA/BcrD ATPase family protein [uncultured Massilia sp.]|uniref:BadF/BadG/BcrA/BcrD ATPase family protein n=1 Tax=uncultured Massilia sp. TaxID=169973 RepID=UPI0025DC19D0|nr:BadF/BadG/BcrA/BcrD ATPase family protein [uncultured Massilia sp.]